MKTGKITLKKMATSAKFGVTFPAGKPLNFFEETNGRVMAQHPTMTNVYMLIRKSNVETKTYDADNQG
jgi:hypothetical protein